MVPQSVLGQDTCSVFDIEEDLDNDEEGGKETAPKRVLGTFKSDFSVTTGPRILEP